MLNIYRHAQVTAIQDLLLPVLRRLPEDILIIEQLDILSRHLADSYRNNGAAAKYYFKSLIAEVPEINLFSSRDLVAIDHGYSNWEAVIAEAQHPLSPEFELAVDTLLEGDLPTLKDLLYKHPELLQQKSAYGHQASLLHYAGSNGVEVRRQQVPHNLVEISAFLIESGADPNATMNVYGGQYTPHALAASSSHPFEAGVGEQLLSILSV